MYLHPLIHTELTRQHQLEISRRTLDAPLAGGLGSRTRAGKATGAKIGALIIAVIAALALTTGAYAAGGTKRPTHGKSHKGAVAAAVHRGNGTVRVVSPRIIYIYAPGPTQPPSSSPTDSSDDCAYYQLNCTDEQNCQFWGINCELVSNITNATQVANQDNPAGETTSAQDDSSSEPVADAAASTDGAATDQLANLSDPGLSDDEDC